MTAPKPKPLGSTIEVAEGATVIRPGDDSAAGRVISGGLYVLDVPGVHVVEGREITVDDGTESAATS